MAYKNKEDQAACTKRYYEANKELAVQAAMQRKKVQVAFLKKYVEDLKSLPCSDCGKCFHFVAMDFDHVHGAKKMDIAVMVNQGYSLKTLQSELDKCELVCSNCHRVRTWRRLNKGS